MAKFKNENGEEFEAFTKEELDAAKLAALEEAKKALEPEMNQLKEDLKKEQEKDKNFGKVKTESEEKIAGLEKKYTDLHNSVVGGKKEEILAKLSGGDAETRRKIELEYAKFAGEAVTPQEIESRMLNATKLAIPDVSVNSLDDAFSKIGARSKKDVGTETKVATESEKKMGDMLGITDADRAKYEPVINSNIKA